ncbi:hypothetical protein [Rhodococcus qingshengii]|uniref:hypothetical protein n=1 Tax=Rhodococcus qingshengii TaxID=334542 RepID=UPI000B036CAC|nr:hypothetical protein [Rhodococcus qingshengii]
MTGHHAQETTSVRESRTLRSPLSAADPGHELVLVEQLSRRTLSLPASRPSTA